MNDRVGFVGLGRMGLPMAHRLVRAGSSVSAYSRSRPPVDELVAAGARAAASPHDVAAAADVVFTMLPDGPDVAAVLRGPEGILAGARRGTIVVDTSTISSTAARDFAVEAATEGVVYLDVPVSGGPEGAAAGTLSLMAGGDAAAFERVRPLLETLGTTIVYCGLSGSGQVTKACNQLVVAINIEAIAEAIVLARKAGVPAQTMLRVLGGGLAGSRIMELRGAAMAANDFTPRGRAAFHRKDLAHVLALARTHDVALPVTALVDQLFTALVAGGDGDLDHTALLKVVASLSSVATSDATYSSVATSDAT